MGIELPPELAAVAAAAGVTWPRADEDAMREAAQAWRDAGTQMSTLTGDADTVARTTLSAVEGETGTAAANHWTRFVAPDTGYLTATARGCAGAADRLDHAAEQVGAAKVEIVRDLVALARNSDAANQAAAAGNPSALLGLDIAVRGTAVNVAAITDTLISAVQPASGQDVAAVRDVVNANPGVHGGSLLGGVVDGLAHTVAGTTGALGDVGVGLTGAVAQTATGATAGVVQTVGGVAQTATGLTGDVAGGAVEGLGQTVGGVTHGVGQTAVGVTTGVTETVGGVTHGVAETAGGATHGLMQTADGASRIVAETAGEALPVDFYGGDANAGTGPIRLPMDAIADAPTPPTGFPAVANETVQAASAAVLDAPAQSPAAQPLPGQPGAPTANAPGIGGVPGAGGVPATGAPISGGPAGGALGGGPVGGGAIAGGGSAPGGGRQQQAPAPGRESTAVPVPDQRGRQGAQPSQQPAGSRPAGYAVAMTDQPAPDHSDHREHPVQGGSLALFLVHMFPIGHLPKATSRPARQLPAPPAELDYAAGLRFEADDHPESGLIDLTTRKPTPRQPEDAQAPAELTEGYDPLAGEHERDWDRRFLVRDTHPVEYAWPPGELYPEGGSAEGEPEVLAVDTEIDRFGTPEGRVFSAAATRFGARSLPPAHLEAGYHRYRLLRPIPVWRSVSAPWFGQPGGGERYRATQSAADLIALGYLADTTHGDEQ